MKYHVELITSDALDQSRPILSWFLCSKIGLRQDQFRTIARAAMTAFSKWNDLVMRPVDAVRILDDIGIELFRWTRKDQTKDMS